MRPYDLRGTRGAGSGSRFSVFLVIAAISIVLSAASLLDDIRAGEIELPRNALWEVVHNVCVPGQLENRDPTPCSKVDVNQGIDRGFAILRDPRGGTQFLLVPTVPIPGIESPIVRERNAANYFALAWEVRTTLNEALHRELSRDQVGLAINSFVSRSQDQLHIHFSCLRIDVAETLHKNESQIGTRWARFGAPLYGQRYMAMWVPGEHLRPRNPFRLLAEGLPNAASTMASRTLVVIGFTRSDRTPGFVILADQANVPAGDFANGEELLDHSCQIAAKGNKRPDGPAQTPSL